MSRFASTARAESRLARSAGRLARSAGLVEGAVERSAACPRGPLLRLFFCAALVAGALTFGASGCSTPTDEQPYAGDCAPFFAIDWTPSGGSTDVPRSTPVRVHFNQYPDPETVDLTGFIVTTGVYYHPGTMHLDMVDKAVTYAPQGAWQAELGYNVVVRKALRSLQGCAVMPEQRSFRTSNDAPANVPAPAAVTYGAIVGPLFATRCAGAACHRATVVEGGGCLAAPAAGLSLCDADAETALLDVPSTQIRHLKLIEPRDSSRSYLLRKLLPGDTPDRPAPTTFGQRCPPGAPLSSDELHAIESWIDQGLPR